VAEIKYLPEALADLDRVEQFAPGALELLTATISMLAESPLLGRPTAGPLRELIVSRGKTGYVVLYRFDEPHDMVRILPIRHQREVWRQ
jgi:plasmid stabilization system protein ParE